MPLNIKDDLVHQQARQLAALTGESLTLAVRNAVSERLARVTEQQQVEQNGAKREKLVALARLCAAGLRHGAESSDHAALFGEDGLPL